MNKNMLKGWLSRADSGKELSEYQKKVLIDLWDVMMYWGACDGSFYSVRDIADGFGVSTNTIYAKIKRFKSSFPEAHNKLEEDRKRARRVCKRQAASFRQPLSWDRLQEEFGSEPENWIKEKF